MKPEHILFLCALTVGCGLCALFFPSQHCIFILAGVAIGLVAGYIFFKP